MDVRVYYKAMWRLTLRILMFLACAALPAGAAPAGATEDPARTLDLIKPNRQQQAKDFNVAALEGGKVRLADLKGKVVFLNLWATWCPPCKEEMPAMERLWQRYKAQGLVVIALSMDSAGAKVVKPFIDQAKYTYRVALDPKMEIAQLYGAHSIPSTFIIDRSGMLRAIALGPRDWDGRASFAYFDALLKDGKPRG
ncbi:MAG: TlpA family protein disulfide reductase [Candidatus Rokubacteria bacterium]|nr:TlpA family protein disulfide reductase [Candidatus Rokubacteria bacterium]HLF49851.1 TlpA disulfide reductase family protein [Methylomirabilota bacterium]